MLLQGRTKLVVESSALRYKIKASDGNEIDTIFVDNRQTKSSNDNGKMLVICSEGNAGFYEIGIISTPLDLNYSVLGWNHPGFGGSTVSMHHASQSDYLTKIRFISGLSISRSRSKSDRRNCSICYSQIKL